MRNLIARRGGLAAVAVLFLTLQLHEAPAVEAGLPVCTGSCINQLFACRQQAHQCEQECFDTLQRCGTQAGRAKEKCLQSATTPPQVADCEAAEQAALEDCENDHFVCRNRCVNACFNCPDFLCLVACGGFAC